jgi:hypothetical protein
VPAPKPGRGEVDTAPPRNLLSRVSSWERSPGSAEAENRAKALT